MITKAHVHWIGWNKFLPRSAEQMTDFSSGVGGNSSLPIHKIFQETNSGKIQFEWFGSVFAISSGDTHGTQQTSRTSNEESSMKTSDIEKDAEAELGMAGGNTQNIRVDSEWSLENSGGEDESVDVDNKQETDGNNEEWRTISNDHWQSDKIVNVEQSLVIFSTRQILRRLHEKYRHTCYLAEKKISYGKSGYINKRMRYDQRRARSRSESKQQRSLHLQARASSSGAFSDFSQKMLVFGLQTFSTVKISLKQHQKSFFHHSNNGGMH